MSAPISPPTEWFYQPEPDGPQPLRYTEDGQVTGHLAVKGSCHTGFLNGALAECVRPPESRTGYQQFHLGSMLTEEGDEIQVGKLTFDTSHAPLSVGMQAAARHYDSTGAVGAFVRAVDGRHGIWLSGAVRSDLSAEGLRDMRANPPSGDWRAFNGALELIAALSVPVPGFPVKPQFSLAASGSNELESLILPGYNGDMEVEDEPDYRERRAELVASLTPEPVRDGKAYLRRRAVLAAALTTAERKQIPMGMFALPGRRYPIDTRARAVNALARVAQNGTPEEMAAVKRAVCRKYGDLPSCKQ